MLSSIKENNNKIDGVIIRIFRQQCIDIARKISRNVCRDLQTGIIFEIGHKMRDCDNALNFQHAMKMNHFAAPQMMGIALHRIEITRQTKNRIDHRNTQTSRRIIICIPIERNERATDRFEKCASKHRDSTKPIQLTFDKIAVAIYYVVFVTSSSVVGEWTQL